MVFEETPTLGVRSYSASRTVLEREIVEVQTPLGRIRVKVSLLEGRVVNAAPEYDDCRAIAEQTGTPLPQVMTAAVEAYLKTK